MHAPVIPTAEFRASATQCSKPDRDTPFVTYDERFVAVTGAKPQLFPIAESETSLFHEAGVYVPVDDDTGDVWITSNILPVESDAVEIEICKLNVPKALQESKMSSSSRSGVSVADHVKYTACNLQYEMPMGNGATAWNDKILFCSQGQDRLLPAGLKKRGSQHASSLVTIDPRNAGKTVKTVVNNFHGRQFTSLNDVVVHEATGAIFFTGPDYGLEQKFKSASHLPNAVWRFDPNSGVVEMAADGIPKPNGVVFSPDGKTCYVTDTDFIHGDGNMDPSRAGTIYAFDVVVPKQGLPQLHNKRVFAFVDCGAPDGIKCDEQGNVYTGCFDGVHVFSPEGSLVGKIVLPVDKDGNQPGCANLVFAGPHQLVILSETKVWLAVIAASGHLKGVTTA